MLSRDPPARRAQEDSAQSIWRTGQHEFNSETSDGTWGFSQFVLASTLISSPGLLSSDDVVVIRVEMTVRWKRSAIPELGLGDGEAGAAAPDPGLEPETGVSLPPQFQ